MGRRGLTLLFALAVLAFVAALVQSASLGQDGSAEERERVAPSVVSEPQPPERVAGAIVGPAEQAPYMRTVSALGPTGVAASGDFRGTGKSQVALLRDPAGDLTLRISLLDVDATGDAFTESLWYITGPNSFSLARAKFAVADVTFDGKDDLVALYNDGGSSVRLLVFRSTGSGFVYTGNAGWWQSDGYAWSRARVLLAGNFSGIGRNGLLIAYQYDNFQMRIHYLESTGSSFVYTGNQGVYDSGPGQYDTARARFAVGHFTRTSGPQQVASFYQYPNLRIRLHLFEPSPSGLVPLNGWAGIYDSGEGEYDLGRAAISAADVTGDGKHDLVSLYGYSDGSARVHVFDAATSFRPANGWTGWGTLPASSVCVGATGLVVGDWNGDKKGDATALTLAQAAEVRANVLRNLGTSFKLTVPTGELKCARWPLTGLSAQGGISARPLYVKIDNNPSARPHYGISRADQVYEWLVEGMTTRLAAVFHSMAPGEIGSVRSARMTDRLIVPSLRGVIVYSGGGPEELMGLNYDYEVGRYIDLSPRFGWGYRVGFRVAPYNLFTTYDNVKSAVSAAAGGDAAVNVPSWNFLATAGGDPMAGGFGSSVAATTVTVPYRGGFGVRYDYDPGTRAYARYQNGVREVDGANGEAVVARNVVVILTEVWLTDLWGLDPAGSLKLDMKLTGSGTAYIFRDGRRQAVTWTRPDIWDVYVFKNAQGEVVQLSPGQTWIHIVPNDWAIPSE